MRFCRALVVLLWAFPVLAGDPFQAASGSSDEQKGRAVLEAAVQALGGNAFLHARDLREEGRAFQFDRFEDLRGMALFVGYEKFPGKERQELGKDKDVIFVLNGDKAWEKDFHGVRALREDEMKRLLESRRLSVEYLLRFGLKEAGAAVRYAGSDIMNRRAVDIVDVQDADNRLVTIVFDQTNHLPLRRQWVHRDPKTNLPSNEVETLGNYRDVDGIQIPFYRLRERDGQKIFEVFLREADFNRNMPDSLFDRPPGPDRPEPGRKKR